MTRAVKTSHLTAAKTAKNDEFYTQWADIEREMNAYLEFDPDVFRDKVILHPCDDPEWSNFTKFFALHFVDFGLKKLISTSYAPDSNPAGEFYQPTLFETNDPKFDATKTRVNGKKFVLEPKDINGDGVVNIDDLQWEYLEGDGDFRSAEVIALRDEADLITTNPPFSLFRSFVAWVAESGKQFSFIGNMNAITYKEIFPLIKQNKMWLGRGFQAGNAYFATPHDAGAYAKGVYDAATGLVKWRNACWLTNIDHGRRHEPLQLMTHADNLKFNKKLIKSLDGATDYLRYVNYDAIEVPFTDAIPSDYDGVMGVPITFLDRYNPDQFEIMGTNDNGLVSDSVKVTPGLTQKFVDDYYAGGGTGSYKAGNPTAGYYDANGIARMAYKRLFIRRKDA